MRYLDDLPAKPRISYFIRFATQQVTLCGVISDRSVSTGSCGYSRSPRCGLPIPTIGWPEAQPLLDLWIGILHTETAGCLSTEVNMPSFQNLDSVAILSMTMEYKNLLILVFNIIINNTAQRSIIQISPFSPHPSCFLFNKFCYQSKMKATTICSLLFAASTALAVPTKRAGEDVTISGLYASQTAETGFVTFILVDPNYNDTTGANIAWYSSLSPPLYSMIILTDMARDIPGQPLTDSRTVDGNYFVHFPGGVNDISVFNLDVVRVKGPEEFSITLNDNGNGAAPGTKWLCVTATGSEVSKKCHYNGNITFPSPN